MLTEHTELGSWFNRVFGSRWLAIDQAETQANILAAKERVVRLPVIGPQG